LLRFTLTSEQNMTEQVAYTLPEFCLRFGIGKTKAHSEINAGRLKARKNGTRTIVTAADAQTWLDSLPIRTPNKAA
jgi:hypothetical protein